MRLPMILAAMLLFTAPAGGAEVYRCVTTNGDVRYSDKPCPDGKTEKLPITSAPTDRQAVEARVETRKEQIKALDESESAAAEAEQKAQAEAAEREQQCAAARERLQRLTIARRVTTGQGEEKRYLEDAEIIERRQQAQDRVNELCDD